MVDALPERFSGSVWSAACAAISSMVAVPALAMARVLSEANDWSHVGPVGVMRRAISNLLPEWSAIKVGVASRYLMGSRVGKEFVRGCLAVSHNRERKR